MPSLAAALMLGLAACGAVPRTTASAPPAIRPASTPPAQSLAGLDAVIGRTEPQLVALLGRPRLDVREGQARKLQFVGAGCVLDLYLYPPAPGREAVARYADARQLSGADTDRAHCLASLSRR